MQHPTSAGRHPAGLSRGARRTLCVTALALASTACQDNAATAPTSDPASARAAAEAAVSTVKTDTVAIGDSLQLAAPKGGNGQISWTTTSAAVATVTRDGLARAISEGTATLRVARRGTIVDSTRIVVASRTAPTPTPTPTPVPTPTPAPAPAAAGTAAAVLAFMGVTNVPSVASVQARGGAYAKYEADFVQFADYHWNGPDSTSQAANFYDRASIYYVWWARTGNATYLERANKLAVAARNYLSGLPQAGYAVPLTASPYYPQSYQMMVDGVALHALVTGDTASRYTVARLADTMGAPNSWFAWVAGNPGDGNNDGRNSAKVLTAVLDAYLLKVPSPMGLDYAARLRDLETRILSTQASNGGYPWANQCGFNKPYMNGMLNHALIRYHGSFEADSRIVQSVKAAVDYMWTNDWFSASSAFTYLEGYCANTGESGGAPGAADLNNLISSGYAFVAKQTGDASYYTKADAVFTGGVNGTWLYGPKQFNQEYTASYEYLALRF